MVIDSDTYSIVWETEERFSEDVTRKNNYKRQAKYHYKTRIRAGHNSDNGIPHFLQVLSFELRRILHPYSCVHI